MQQHKEKQQSLSVRTKIVLVLLASIVVLLGLVWAITSAVLLGSYKTLERSAVVQDLRRAQDAITEFTRQQSVKLEDWSRWDDSHQYVIDRNAEYVVTNINAAAPTNLDLTAMVYLDTTGSLVRAIVVDLSTGEEVSADAIVAAVTDDPLLARHASLESTADGIVMLANGPLIVNSRPLRKTGGAGPASGTLVFARYLDDAKIADIGQVTHLSLSAFRYDAARMPEDVVAAKAVLSLKTPDHVVPVNDELVRGYTLIPDLHGAPSLILRIESPRSIYAQGQLTFELFMGALAVALAIFGIIVVVLIDRAVIARFLRLSRDVERINDDRDIETKVSEGEQDEIGKLGANINQMLTWLTESREAEAASRREMLNLLDEQKKEKAQAEEMRKLSGQ